MGVFEEAKGKAKEVIGDLTDDPDLEREGRAQQEKGEAEREATRARVEADAKDEKAEVLEEAQAAAERARKHQSLLPLRHLSAGAQAAVSAEVGNTEGNTTGRARRALERGGPIEVPWTSGCRER